MERADRILLSVNLPKRLRSAHPQSDQVNGRHRSLADSPWPTIRSPKPRLCGQRHPGYWNREPPAAALPFLTSLQRDNGQYQHEQVKAKTILCSLRAARPLPCRPSFRRNSGSAIELASLVRRQKSPTRITRSHFRVPMKVPPDAIRKLPIDASEVVIRLRVTRTGLASLLFAILRPARRAAEMDANALAAGTGSTPRKSLSATLRRRNRSRLDMVWRYGFAMTVASGRIGSVSRRRPDFPRRWRSPGPAGGAGRSRPRSGCSDRSATGWHGLQIRRLTWRAAPSQS